jgi:hypothetical protein
MGNYLEFVWPSEPVPSESNATAPGAEDQGMTETPPKALDPRLIGHELARIESLELLELLVSWTD